MAPKLTTPTDPDALLADLSDEAKLGELMADPKKFGEMIRGYTEAVNKRHADIRDQTRDQVQSVLAEWLKENESELLGNTVKNALPGARAAYNPTAHNSRAPGAALDGVFSDKADFLQSVYHDRHKFRDSAEREGKLSRVREIQNSFGSTIPADGGFLIPEVMRSELMMVALQSAVVRPRATVIPMESLRVPIPMIDSTSNVSSVFGGIVAYWTEEAAALTESQAVFGRVVLDAKKLTAYAEPPNELIADASAFGGFIEQMFPKAIAWYEDLAFMKGTGAGEPLGWMNAAATVTVTAQSGQGANTLVWENIVGMYARMLPSSLSSAVWVASPDVFPQLATMALSVGTGGAPVWLNNGVEGPAATILGRPVIFTEMASTLGTAGDLNFVDLSYYLIGDRQAMTAMSSPHYKFANDKTAYRFIERVDGRPWIQSAITPQNNGNTLSPFVNLSSTRT